MATAICLRNAVGVYSSRVASTMENKESGSLSIGSLDVLHGKNEVKRRQIVLKEQNSSDGWSPSSTINVQTSSIHVAGSLRWWDEITASNTTEIKSAKELVHSLLDASDKLAVVYFYSPGCGGCKALHTKMCQIEEANTSAVFLRVNYDENKQLCSSLHINVLPFFRFYRGAQGRICSFSCTNATIRKLKDALEKHGAERCNLGPPKGLEESELRSLDLSREIDLAYTMQSSEPEDLSLGSAAASTWSTISPLGLDDGRRRSISSELCIEAV